MADSSRLSQTLEIPKVVTTAEELAAVPGDRTHVAARNIVSHRLSGQLRRTYVLGKSDHAPVVKSARDFAEKVYVLIDEIDKFATPEVVDAAKDVRAMMEDSSDKHRE